MNASHHSTYSPMFRSPSAWLHQVLAFVEAGPASVARQPLHVLEAGDTLEVQLPLSHEVVCLQGRLWITHDHTPADIVIERGQRYLATSASRMLVHAMDDARLMVSPLRA